jgi:hypothetical protein
MRVCDLCMNPDPLKRQSAVATLEVHRLPGVPADFKDLYFDICIRCLAAKDLLKPREEPQG